MSSFLLLASCTKELVHIGSSEDESHYKNRPATTGSFIGNQVFMAFGMNFTTGEMAVFNTLNGSLLEPCPQNSDSIVRAKNSDKLEPEQRCGFKLINDDGQYRVINPQGRAVQDANIQTLTIASFEGSICVVGAVVGGKEYSDCFSVAQVCAALNSDPVAKQNYINTFNQYCQ